MNNLLEGYVPESVVAEQLNVTRRTIGRYRREPNGLPHVKIGGRTLYHVETVRKWIAARMVQPNPTRKPRAAR